MLALLALCLLWGQATAQMTANIYRYPSYAGCVMVSGYVQLIDGKSKGTLELSTKLLDLPPNATGQVQIRSGVSCGDPSLVGRLLNASERFEMDFDIDGDGVSSDNFPLGPGLMTDFASRVVVVRVVTNDSTVNVGCGTLGFAYPAMLSGNSSVRGAVAISGPLDVTPEWPLLVYALAGVEASKAGSVQVYSGAACNALGDLYGGPWTSKWISDANGNAIGSAMISNVKPDRGIKDYLNHPVVLLDSSGGQLACGVFKCPSGMKDSGSTPSGQCVPSTTWSKTVLVLADFFTAPGASAIQAQVNTQAMTVKSLTVRSNNACFENGIACGKVETRFFLPGRSSIRSVDMSFTPTSPTHIVVLGDRQPDTVGRDDNYVTASFPQSSTANEHNVVNVAVGVGQVRFGVAVDGQRYDDLLVGFGQSGTLKFPQVEDAVKTTVYVTDVNMERDYWKQEYWFAKSTPNLVWFLYGWSPDALDCGRQKDCNANPINVTMWPMLTESLGPGKIPPKISRGGAPLLAPGLAVVFSFFLVG